MLAFTFSLAGSRFDERRQAILTEANSIGTTYLRAGLLPEEQAQHVRKLLREYVDSRVKTTTIQALPTALVRSTEIHEQLWAEAEAAAKKRPESVQLALFVNSLNETIDIHTSRVAATIYSRLPVIVWLVLYCLTTLSMALIGYYAGLTSKIRSLSCPVLALSFAAVMLLVADLDRPGEGMIRVNRQVLIDLQDSMNKETNL